MTTHEQGREATTELLENDVAPGRALIEGPRFARWDASIVKQQLDWRCQHCHYDAVPPGESERIADGPADRGVSARTLWLGGIAFAVLVAAIVPGLATVQAIRPLLFEIWAQRNLIQITDGIPGAMTTNAQDPDQLVRGPGAAPNAGSGPVAAPNSFIRLHEALTAARERLEELSKAADMVAATGQLRQELAALREENQLVRAEIEALTKEVEQATAKAREIDQELVAVRAQSEQRIAGADAARVEAEARLSKMRDSLQRAKQEKRRVDADLARIHGELATAKEQVGAARQDEAQVQQRVAALENERDESEQRIAAADKAQAEVEARLSEMRDSLQRAEQEKTRIGAALARIQGELATAKEQVAAAGRERTQIEQRAAALLSERDELRIRLREATALLEPTEAANAQLEREVAKLRQAARTAAEDTRQLIETLAAIGLSAGPLEADAALLAKSGSPSAGDDADGEGSDAVAPVGNVAAEPAPSQSPAPTSANPDLQRTRTASAMLPGGGEGAHLDQRSILGGRPAVFPTLADLPPERRDRVQGLLAELPSKLEQRGLMTTVPGELLFAEGSDKVQAAAAYDTLAKVAELIGMYNARPVRIIGHSDARGDAASNRQLSERRAEHIKEVLVNYFEISADRLSPEGLGDTQPIASNATPEGRRANRRVEVLILN